MTKRVPKKYTVVNWCWNCGKPVTYDLKRGMSMGDAVEKRTWRACPYCGCKGYLRDWKRYNVTVHNTETPEEK